MRRRWLACAAALCSLLAAGGQARAECRITNVGEIPVVVTRDRILIPAEINGHKTSFILDTGALRGELFAKEATGLGIHTRAVTTAEVGRMYGVGGEIQQLWADVDGLKLGGLQFKRLSLPVVIADHERENVAGLIGVDIFDNVDAELDLAHGVIRLLKTPGCSDDQMDYWRAPYAVAPIQWRGGDRHIYVPVKLNGVALEAILDSGSPRTAVTLAGAAQAGVRPGDPGVRQVGVIGGLSGRSSSAYAAPFNTFSVGEEALSHPTLEMADLFGHTVTLTTGTLVPTQVDMPEMLLGLDFLRAHRVIISHQHDKLYMSYLGGPILEPPPAQLSPVQAPPPAQSAPAAPR